MPPNPFESADFYKDINVSSKRIGDEFINCLFNWPFPAGLLVPKNGSIATDIEYSFDGVNVAGRLIRGTDVLKGGEWFTYNNTIRQKIYFRRAHAADGTVEQPGEVDIPYRLWVNKEPGDGDV